MDVKLSLKLSKAVHDRCNNVPHDIGITLEQIVREHQNEQLNIHSVVRGGANETESVTRVEPDFNGRNVMRILYTPTEPLPAAEVAQNGRDGLCNCVNQFFGYVNCGYDCQRNKE